MKLSVIIPCYNAAPTMSVQLDALASQDWSEPWEVIVADNGSTDHSRQIVEGYRNRVPNLCLVDASKRRGAAYARNVGARAATGEALAFCDADDEVNPGWVQAMGEALQQHDFVACRRDHSKLNTSHMQKYVENSAREGLMMLWFPPYLPYTGAGLLGIKRSLHEEVGGFDAAYACGEDVEYCLRVQRQGATLHFVPEAVVSVRFRATTTDIISQGFSWAFYSVPIYKQHCSAEMRLGKGWQNNLAFWLALLSRPPVFSHPTDRARWWWTLAWQSGLLVGGLRYRIAPPFYSAKET